MSFTNEQQEIINNIKHELNKKLTINGERKRQFYDWDRDTRTPADSTIQFWKLIITIRGTRGPKNNPNPNGFTPREFYEYCLDLILDYVHIITADSKNNVDVEQIENVRATLDNSKLHYEQKHYEGCINNGYASEQLGKIMHSVWILEETANIPLTDRISKEHTFYNMVEKPKRIGQYNARKARRDNRKSVRDLNRPEHGRPRPSRQPRATTQWQKVPEIKQSTNVSLPKKQTNNSPVLPATPPPTPAIVQSPLSLPSSSVSNTTANDMRAEELKSLKADFDNLLKQYEQLEKQLDDANATIDDLKSNAVKDSEQILFNQQQLVNADDDNNRLLNTISEQETTIAKQAETITEQAKANAMQMQIIHNLTTALASAKTTQ
jgi:hypothetical protein